MWISNPAYQSPLLCAPSSTVPCPTHAPGTAAASTVAATAAANALSLLSIPVFDCASPGAVQKTSPRVVQKAALSASSGGGGSSGSGSEAQTAVSHALLNLSSPRVLTTTPKFAGGRSSGSISSSNSSDGSTGSPMAVIAVSNALLNSSAPRAVSGSSYSNSNSSSSPTALAVVSSALSNLSSPRGAAGRCRHREFSRQQKQRQQSYW